MEGMPLDQTNDHLQAPFRLALIESENKLMTRIETKMEQQTKSIETTVSRQNGLFSGNILELTKNVAKLEEKVKIMNVKIITVSSATAVFGGLIGFFVSNMVR